MGISGVILHRANISAEATIGERERWRGGEVESDIKRQRCEKEIERKKWRKRNIQKEKWRE